MFSCYYNSKKHIKILLFECIETEYLKVEILLHSDDLQKNLRNIILNSESKLSACHCAYSCPYFFMVFPYFSYHVPF